MFSGNRAWKSGVRQIHDFRILIAVRGLATGVFLGLLGLTVNSPASAESADPTGPAAKTVASAPGAETRLHPETIKILTSVFVNVCEAVKNGPLLEGTGQGIALNTGPLLELFTQTRVLNQGDIIKSLNGKGTPNLDALTQVLKESATHPGDLVFEVERSGKLMTVAIKSDPSQPPPKTQPAEKASAGRGPGRPVPPDDPFLQPRPRALFQSYVPVNDLASLIDRAREAAAKQTGNPGEGKAAKGPGVIVQGGVLQQAFAPFELCAGDTIVAVNEHNTPSLTELAEALRSEQAIGRDGEMTITFDRKGQRCTTHLVSWEYFGTYGNPMGMHRQPLVSVPAAITGWKPTGTDGPTMSGLQSQIDNELQTIYEWQLFDFDVLNQMVGGYELCIVDIRDGRAVFTQPLPGLLAPACTMDLQPGKAQMRLTLYDAGTGLPYRFNTSKTHEETGIESASGDHLAEIAKVFLRESLAELQKGFPKLRGSIVAVDGARYRIDLGSQQGLLPYASLDVFAESSSGDKAKEVPVTQLKVIAVQETQAIAIQHPHAVVEVGHYENDRGGGITFQEQAVQQPQKGMKVQVR